MANTKDNKIKEPSISVSKFREFRHLLESGMKEGDTYNFGLAVLIWSEASWIVSHLRLKKGSRSFFDAGVAAKEYYRKNLKRWEKDAYMSKHYTEWIQQKRDAYAELQKYF